MTDTNETWRWSGGKSNARFGVTFLSAIMCITVTTKGCRLETMTKTHLLALSFAYLLTHSLTRSLAHLLGCSCSTKRRVVTANNKNTAQYKFAMLLARAKRWVTGQTLYFYMTAMLTAVGWSFGRSVGRSIGSRVVPTITHHLYVLVPCTCKSFVIMSLKRKSEIGTRSFQKVKQKQK